MNFIKIHWFGIIISIFVFYFLSVFFVVMISPHQDEQRRGFVPCTESMAESLHKCGSRKLCILKAVSENTFCDIGVINEGIRLWLRGEQLRPWSNYMFLSNREKFNEDLQDFLDEDSDFENQMSELDNKRKELEKALSAPSSVVFADAWNDSVEETGGESYIDDLDDENIKSFDGVDDE